MHWWHSRYGAGTSKPRCVLVKSLLYHGNGEDHHSFWSLAHTPASTSSIILLCVHVRSDWDVQTIMGESTRVMSRLSIQAIEDTPAPKANIEEEDVEEENNGLSI